MSAAKEPKPFADLDTALDCLDASDLISDIEGAIDGVKAAETVETMADFQANLDAAEEALKAALRRIQRLNARAKASISAT